MSIDLFAQLVAHGVNPREAAASTNQRVSAEELLLRDNVQEAIEVHRRAMRKRDLSIAKEREPTTRAQFIECMLSTLEAAQTRRDVKTVSQCIGVLGQLAGIKETDATEQITVKMDWSKDGMRQAKRRAS